MEKAGFEVVDVGESVEKEDGCECWAVNSSRPALGFQPHRALACFIKAVTGPLALLFLSSFLSLSLASFSSTPKNQPEKKKRKRKRKRKNRRHHHHQNSNNSHADWPGVSFASDCAA